jgi:hypothetical protein
MVNPISIRYATEEDYKKLNFYNVSSLRRASPLPVTEQSDGEEKNTASQPKEEPEDQS